MNCPKCPNVLVEANFIFEHREDGYYNRYYCFGCDSLFEINSCSGDFIQENLIELG